MKTKKAFLAKVLAAAVTITSILPGGAFTANAATIKDTTDGWKVERDSGNWSGKFDDALNLGGIQTWRLKAQSTDGNKHEDLSASDAAATVFAKNIDITAPDRQESAGETDTKDGEVPNRKLSFDIYPDGTAGAMRFGVLLKYVDSTHYVYLGNHSKNHWFLEWGPGIPIVEGTEQDPHRYTGQISDLAEFSLEDCKFHRITIEYLSSSQIKVTMQKMQEQPKEDGSGKTEWVPTEETAETILTHESILKVKEYAVSEQAPNAQKEIYFGFIAGNFSNVITDVDIANIQTNANADNTMESLRYGYCGWTSPKTGTDPGVVLKPTSVGGVNYLSVDADGLDDSKSVFNKMPAMQDFREGTVSAVLRPFIALGNEGDVEKEFYLNTRVVTPASPNAPAIKVGYNGTAWGYKIGNEAFTAVSNGAKPKRMHDYKVDVTFSPDNKFSAKVVEVQPSGDESRDENDPDYLTNDYSTVVEGSEIVIADQVSLEGKTVAAAGSISLTAGAGLNLRVRNVNFSKVNESLDFADWEDSAKNTYATIMAKSNAPVVYYKEAWDAFQAVRTAKSGILTGTGVITAQGARGIINEMNAAWTTLDTTENKVATGKTALEEAKNEMTSKAESGYYTYDTAAYETAKTDVDAVLAKITAGDQEVTKAEADSALAKCAAVTFTEKIADEEEKKAAIEAAVSKATSGVNEADAEYYDNWDAYKEALEAVNALKTNAAATQKQVDEAIAALEEAAANRTLKAAEPSDREALKNSIAAIKKEVNANLQPNAEYNTALQEAEALANGSAATTKKALADALKKLEAAKAKLAKKPVVKDEPKLTKGLKAKFGNNDYTVVDPVKNTVALTKWNSNKAKNVVVPEKVTINGVSCTVVTVSKNAFKNFAKLSKVTFPKSIATIEKSAFSGCKALKNVIFKGATTKVAKNAFKGVKKKVTVKVPTSVKKNKKAKSKFQKMVKKAGLKKNVVK
ncbi:MAG: leucine-rich repeat protein [Eubacterium sp.]|nr:leucine-rich repeat protein [Eubacterium sp.]